MQPSPGWKWVMVHPKIMKYEVDTFVRQVISENVDSGQIFSLGCLTKPLGVSSLLLHLLPASPSSLPPCHPLFLVYLLPSSLPCSLPSFLPFFLPSCLPACLPFFLSSCLPACLPASLPSFLLSLLATLLSALFSASFCAISLS